MKRMIPIMCSCMVTGTALGLTARLLAEPPDNTLAGTCPKSGNCKGLKCGLNTCKCINEAGIDLCVDNAAV